MTGTSAAYRALRVVLDKTATEDMLSSDAHAVATIAGRLTEDLPAIGLKAGQLLRIAVADGPADVIETAKLLTKPAAAATLNSLYVPELIACFVLDDYSSEFDHHQFAATIRVPQGSERDYGCALLAAITRWVKLLEEDDNIVSPEILVITHDAPGTITIYGSGLENEAFPAFRQKVWPMALQGAKIDPDGVTLSELDESFAFANGGPLRHIATPA